MVFGGLSGHIHTRRVVTAVNRYITKQTIETRPPIRSRRNVHHDGPGEAWSGFERAESPSQGPGQSPEAPFHPPRGEGGAFPNASCQLPAAA
jgi:hypothetical protein